MPESSRYQTGVILLLLPILILQLIGAISLWSIIGSKIFGYLILICVIYAVFFVTTKIDFEIVAVFSKYFYIFSIALLFFNLILGSTSRGVSRWIPIGGYAFQPSEIVRPFIYLYLSFLLARDWQKSTSLLRLVLLCLVPVILIVLQPSLGVAILTTAGIAGIFLASGINKSYFLKIILGSLLFIPLFFMFLRPYQKERLVSFLNPWENPTSMGYNSVQSMISVGSGSFLGRGLGEGVGTSLNFLPEKNTDFIFAAISEEMGFVGSLIILSAFIVFFWNLIDIYKRLPFSTAKLFTSGVFVSLLVQTTINIGMNIGILPITGVPLPFVSEGGSSLMSTLIAVGLILSAATQKRVVLDQN